MLSVQATSVTLSIKAGHKGRRHKIFQSERGSPAVLCLPVALDFPRSVHEHVRLAGAVTVGGL